MHDYLNHRNYGAYFTKTWESEYSDVFDALFTVYNNKLNTEHKKKAFKKAFLSFYISVFPCHRSVLCLSFLYFQVCWLVSRFYTDLVLFFDLF